MHDGRGGWVFGAAAGSKGQRRQPVRCAPGPRPPAELTHGGGQSGLVNVYAQNIANGNQVILLQNVPVAVAANLCGLTTTLLPAPTVHAPGAQIRPSPWVPATTA